MDSNGSQTNTATATGLASPRSHSLYALFHELWTCGRCGREFGDCTSCVAHEQQCGGQLERW
jgi:hypothetical protein